MKIPIQYPLTGTLVSLLTCASAAQVDKTLITVLRNGDPAEMIGPGLTFGGFCNGGNAINDAGQVIVQGTITGSGVTASNNSVLVAGMPGSLQSLAREADPIPGTPTAMIYQPILNGAPFTGWVLNESGEVAMYAVSSSGEQLVVGPPGALNYVTGEQSQAPDLPAGVNNAFLHEPIALNAIGLAAWQATVIGIQSVIYSGDEVGQVAWQNTDDPAPQGLAPAWTLTDPPYMNDQGRLAYVVTLSSAVPGNQRSVIYAGLPDFPGVAARTGFVAPDTGGGTYGRQIGAVFRGFDAARLRIADNDSIAFAVPVTASGTDGAIFLGLFSNIRIYAFDGMQAPGLPPGVLLNDLGMTRIELNSNSSVAFRAKLTGPGVDASNDSAIFEGPPTQIRLLVREGDAAPGGGTIGELAGGVYLAYNDRRQVVFTNTTSTGQVAYFGTTPGGQLAEFARQNAGFFPDDSPAFSVGNVFSRGPGGQAIGSAESGWRSAFNNRGEFIFDLCGSGSTGVFIATAEDAVPRCPNAVARPLEVFDYLDVVRFLKFVEEQDSNADIAPPGGAPDALDMQAFITGIGLCP